MTPTHVKAKEKERKRPIYSNLDPNKLDQTRVCHMANENNRGVHNFRARKIG